MILSQDLFASVSEWRSELEDWARSGLPTVGRDLCVVNQSAMICPYLGLGVSAMVGGLEGAESVTTVRR